jgi:hypothetical protein
MRRRHAAFAAVAVVVLGAVVAWREQSALMGLALRWYLGRVAAHEARDGNLDRRRATVAGMHRLLLMAPPPDALVPELYDVLTLLGQRMVAGDVPFDWGAYLYTDYYRTLVAERPDGTPPRTPAEVRTALDRVVAFYAVRARPGEGGMRVGDVFGAGDGYTKDEIEQAAREGRTLPLR